ncbi:uncharacterized protein LOC111714093 [Eurytemora carolleeae]|uniref:uncharacterized protein LOC111714093 n=1 Tax=Eurytemora carolleeae TaxID=1294199 RepID=UPI000C7919F1|nr:uncharacterized protein LOC111714093 [Eurytemora carolleeae]|eukprot:XP_023344900.1 uncharacterized protein LOC111714093 [Eurytemora affinis]
MSRNLSKLLRLQSRRIPFRASASSIPILCSNPSGILQSALYQQTRYLSEDVSQGGGEEGAEEAEQLVIVERLPSLHIMTIGINRPNKRNCVNTETGELLKNAFLEFEADEDMYCAVLHGIGGSFCAGYDLEELSDLQDGIANKVAEILMDQGPMGPTKMALTKPVIAAVDGYCVAGGLELAIMCDLRVVEENAKLGFLNRRFGVPLIDGGTVRLPQIIGFGRAMDLILTGRLIEPREALDWGLANRVVSTGTVFGQAVNLAKEIVKFPQECLKVDRASAYNSTFSRSNFEDSMEYESLNAASVLTTEAVSGAKKFAAGLGRGGKFNVHDVSSKTDWQIELEEMKKKKKEEEKK